MPSLERNIDPIRGLVLPVGIQKIDAPSNKMMHAFAAQIDTGASISMISQQVIDEVGLEPAGETEMLTASDIVAVNTYLVKLHLVVDGPEPGRVQSVRFAKELTVGQFKSGDDGILILVGMDIILKTSLLTILGLKGSFKLTLWFCVEV